MIVTELARQQERRRSSVASEPVFNFLAPQWDGQCFYGAPTLQEGEQTDETTSTPPKYKALSVAFNEQFSLVALGLSKYADTRRTWM